MIEHNKKVKHKTSMETFVKSMLEGTNEIPKNDPCTFCRTQQRCPEDGCQLKKNWMNRERK
jgi:hypothetical protein